MFRKSIFFLLLVLGISFSLLCQNEIKQNEIPCKTFPDSWDQNKNLRGSNGKVLTWSHFVDTIRHFEYKSCLVFFISKDSIGNPEYFVSSHYTNETPFDNWTFSSIHFGPKSPGLSGFWDVHLEVFNHKPTLNEMQTLLSRWRFKLKDKNTVEYGVDEELWFNTFGFDFNLLNFDKE